MSPEDFIQSVKRTESPVDNIAANKYALNRMFEMLIASGQLIDMMKKNVFYGKPFSYEKINNEIDTITKNADFFDSLADISLYFRFPQEIHGIDPRIFHGIVGIITEAIELAEVAHKAVNGTAVDKVNLKEEIGDLAWYIFLLIDAVDGDWNDILTRNIEKLRTRYPEKFTSHHAINRDLSAEREALS